MADELEETMQRFSLSSEELSGADMMKNDVQKCGQIGHSEKSCQFRGKGSSDHDEPQFGSWLKANNNKVKGSDKRDSSSSANKKKVSKLSP
ncbi:hypothetical protein ACH5RR_023644 [Cinchona calisaya]|uniref:Uncharacterized protein n=1 Tax=Cinchona calisaya TaxID=153742 RepID=A0ABD2ZED7_9GENT